MIDPRKVAAADRLESKGKWEDALSLWKDVNKWDRAIAAAKNLSAAKAKEVELKARKEAGLYQIREKWARAAEIWEQLGEDSKAAYCWEHAGHYLNAALSYRKLGDRENFAKALAKVRERAERFEGDGKFFWAAMYWEKIDEWFRAARNWESLKKWEKAASCWELAGNFAEASKCWALAKEDSKAETAKQKALDEAEALVKANHFSKSAAIFESLSLWQYAATAWESAMNWGRARAAYLKAGDGETAAEMEKKAKEDAKLIKEKYPAIAASQLLEIGDMDGASHAWSSKEWARTAMHLEASGNLSGAAKAWESAQEWITSGDAYSKLEEWSRAYRAYERAGDLDRMHQAERKAEESAYMSEKARDWAAAAKKWEDLRRWDKVAAAWESAGDIDKMRVAMERFARVSQDQGDWINAAIYWKELGKVERAISCYENSSYAKTPQELRFYKDILVKEDVYEIFVKKKRYGLAAYKLLIDAAIKNDFTNKMERMEYLLRDAIKDGDFYIIRQTALPIMLCAYYSNSVEKLITIMEEQTEYYLSILQSITLPETRLLIIDLILDLYRAAFLVAGELGESEKQKLAVSSIEEFTKEYLKISHKKITSKKFLAHYLAYSFLKEDYSRIPSTVGGMRQSADSEIVDAISDLAQDMQTATAVEVAYMYYNYIALKGVPLSSSMSIGQFLDGFDLPVLKYLSPEYFISKIVGSKIELRDELYDHYRDVLKRADKAFELTDYRTAVDLYEEFLNFSVTLAAKTRTTGRLRECLSHLKGDPKYDIKLKKYA
ncbi:MAG: hypothetical protein ABH829_00600 [archaeon]